ncbi:tetratricopeptide repeat protein [Streptomyces sp. NPDC047982]|uniref:serine/threonine-protein kinase n=1 Tax=Streptomyces sp. NPDC047982 TaxID=3365495 RepID=UPI0037119607
MADTRLVQSRYRLLDLIGRGGMGEVWRARDESLGRQVAVKCLKPVGPQHDQSFTRVLRERFRREAHVAASLQHRGVTVVHDFGEDDGVLFLVMELLDGRNLGQLLEDNEQRPLPVPDVVDIAEQVADALGYTHRQGIVHRDLKPANIMRLADGTVKICDFGIARLGRDIGFTSRLTGTGIAMGTPHYMSPEQIGGGQVDHRSDLYSLGCVLYEIATGAPPFDLDDTWAVLVGHRDTEPEPLRARRAELPGFFDRAVLDLLAKEPEERPADAGDLRRRIAVGRTGEQHRPGPTGHVPPASLAPPPPPAPATRPGRELPAWTRGMTTGPKAVGGLPRTAPPRRCAGLTAEWTTATGRWHHSGEAAMGTGAVPRHPGIEGISGTGPWHLAAQPSPARTERPAPSPELLSVLAGRHGAGLNLGRLGHWEEAEEVHRAVAAERERALGPDHPDTLSSRYEIGFTLARTGRSEDALREFGRVAGSRERVLGPDHPDTLAARYETGIALGRLGRSAQALELYRALVGDRIRASGPSHPETLRARHGLGVNLGRLARWEEALAEAREVCAIRERVLGPDHPDTLVSRREVAVGLGWLGRWTDALTLYHQVAETRERVLGAGHPDTLAARNDEAHCLEQTGRGTEAVELYRRVAALRHRPATPPDGPGPAASGRV